MTVHMEWNHDDLKRLTEKSIEAGLGAAAEVLNGQIRANFGSEGGGVSAVKIKTRKGKRTRKNIYAASPPGRFPGVRTGRLRQSIFARKASKLVWQVGSKLAYGKWLEFGWLGKARNGKRYHVPARPWAFRSLAMARERMAQRALDTARSVFSSGAKK